MNVTLGYVVATSFNEAAAICGGKLIHRIAPSADACASMRPPQFAAENCLRKIIKEYTDNSFNEAAAICGGKPISFKNVRTSGMCFNEAAAICGGKRLSDVVTIEEVTLQ